VLSRTFLATLILATTTVAVTGASPPAGAAPAGPPADRTFVIDEGVVDDVDADPGDGTCATVAGMCTLRAAVGEAAALGGVTDVVVGSSVASEVLLSRSGPGGNEAGDLEVPAGVTVRLLGRQLDPTSTTSINAAALGDRIVHVRPGGALYSVLVGFRQGSTTGDGGAILNEGIVHIANAEESLGLFAAFESNTAGGNGGAVANRPGAVLEIANRSTAPGSSQVTGRWNSAAGDGGAVLNEGTMDLQGATGPGGAHDVYLDNNTAGSSGGGIANRPGAGVDLGCRSFVRFSTAVRGGNVHTAGTVAFGSESGLDGGVAAEGGSLYVDDPGTATVTADATCAGDVVQVSRSSADAGGGFFVRGRLFVKAGMTLQVGGSGAAPSGSGAGGLVDGGILEVDGLLRLENLSAVGDGGGLAQLAGLTDADDGLVLAIGNRSGRSGGAVWVAGGAFGGRLWARGNGAAENGGGLAVAAPGSATLQRSSFVRNTADGAGGGVRVSDAAVGMVNSTVAANTAPQGGGLAVTGSKAAITLRHVTVADNAPDGAALAGPLTLQRTLFARNGTNCSGTVTPTAGDLNVADDPSCGPNGTDLTDGSRFATVAARLESDVTGGDDEWSLDPLPGSPAIDFVGDGRCGTPPDDQRGRTRPRDGDLDGTAACDAGAIEVDGWARRRISGTVWDERTGAAFPGICVAVGAFGVDEWYSAVTGPDGRWSVEVPAPAAYGVGFYLPTPPVADAKECSGVIDRSIQAEWWGNLAVEFDSGGDPIVPDPSALQLVKVGDTDVTGVDACLGPGPGPGATAPCPRSASPAAPPAGGPTGVHAPPATGGPAVGGGPDASRPRGAVPARLALTGTGSALVLVGAALALVGAGVLHRRRRLGPVPSRRSPMLRASRHGTSRSVDRKARSFPGAATGS
jgi:hypothetical protein